MDRKRHLLDTTIERTIEQRRNRLMKRSAVVLLAVVLVLTVSSFALAAESHKGTIKGVDPKAGTITFCPEGTQKDMTLKADKSIDLSTVKPETKAEISVEKGTVKDIKEMKKPKASVGC